MSCGIGHRHGLDLVLLWLRWVAVAPTGPLAWEPPYATGAALKKKKKKRERERGEVDTSHTHKGKIPGEDRSRDWNNVATVKKCPVTKDWKRQESHSLLEFPEPSSHLAFSPVMLISYFRAP